MTVAQIWPCASQVVDKNKKTLKNNDPNFLIILITTIIIVCCQNQQFPVAAVWLITEIFPPHFHSSLTKKSFLSTSLCLLINYIVWLQLVILVVGKRMALLPDRANVLNMNPGQMTLAANWQRLLIMLSSFTKREQKTKWLQFFTLYCTAVYVAFLVDFVVQSPLAVLISVDHCYYYYVQCYLSQSWDFGISGVWYEINHQPNVKGLRAISFPGYLTR